MLEYDGGKKRVIEEHNHEINEVSDFAWVVWFSWNSL